MTEVFIVAAKRTAIGTFQGSLQGVTPVQMGKTVIEALLAESGVAPTAIDEVILGNVLGAGQGQNIARQVSLAAGLPEETSAFTLNKVCGSGLKAVQLAFQAIQAGDAQVVIAGGTENMDMAPYVMPKEARLGGLRMGNATLVDTMIVDGLWCASNQYHMGITAENLAKKYSISREDQDQLAYTSQQRALAAIESGAFKAEIAPVSIVARKETKVFDTDEHPRASTLEQLAKLRPAFDVAGTVTAGNASGINDGAAVVLLASAEAVRQNGWTPMAKLVGFATSGTEPACMGYGPVPAIQKLVAKTGVSLDQVDRFELNEAFAVQALSVVRGLGLEGRMDVINPTGGAIALGHPIGASGCRVLVTLLHGLVRDNQKTGLAALCIGGGQGIAALVEKV
jgi:acetyl-CoA C-acetyltransferase